MSLINETHDPALRSWIESANASQTDFPIQNLPFGIFRRCASLDAFRGGVAIGNEILDLAAACKSGVFSSLSAEGARAASGDNLNAFMALGPHVWSELRLVLSRALRHARGGEAPVKLANGEKRVFLEDGDTLTLRAWCQRDGARRIGFGECAGTIVSTR